MRIIPDGSAIACCLGSGDPTRPGRRVLVAEQCQRLRRLVSLLRLHADVFEIVYYQAL